MRAKDLYKSNIKYNKHLSSLVWDDKQQLQMPVRFKLLEIAKKFMEYLDVPDFKLIDVVLRGSLTNYNYTAYSDFDLHLITDFGTINCEDLAREFYDAKKRLWNDAHDIYVNGYEVELYVEDINDTNKSLAAYSVLDNDWLTQPVYNPPEVDKDQVNRKAHELIKQIAISLESNDLDELVRLKDKIKDMRQSGLESGGEYSVENLVFKILRNQGYIGRVMDAVNRAQDQELSLAERKRAKRKKARLVYGWPWGGVEHTHADAGSDAGGGDGGGLEEGWKTNALVTALTAALAMPAHSEPNPDLAPAAQALGIWRMVNKMKGYDSNAAKAEAQQELMNILRAMQGHPNQSKIYPIVKDMIKTAPGEEEPEQLPPLTDPENTVKEQLLAAEQGAWTLVESNETVEFVKSSIFNDTVAAKVKQAPQLNTKLQEFMKFKLQDPTQSWGSKDKPFGGKGPIHQAMPKLRYTHLTHDIILFYTMEGRDPVTIKLYGIFSHDDIGIGQPMNIKKQKSTMQKLVRA